MVEETTKPRENYRPAKSYKLYHIMSRENYRPAKSYKLYHIMLNTEPRENYRPLSHYVKYRTKRKLPTCQKLQTLSHYVKYTSIFKGIKFTSSVVIGTDCIGSCKSNYHTIQGHDSPLQLPYWWNSTYLNRCKDTNDFKILLICPSTIIFNHCEEMRNIKVSYLPFQHFNKGREIFRKGN